MKKRIGFEYIIGVIILFITIYFGTSIFLSFVGTNSGESDPLYGMVRDLLIFSNVLFSLVSSILIILLIIIIVELKKLNEKEH